jgi:hypothetical protein
METGNPLQDGFDATEFRQAIEFAMQMGLPGTESERVTFRWSGSKVFDTPDERGNPYDWTNAPASTESTPDIPASITVPCAVEFRARRSVSGETIIGSFDVASVVITLLDTQYALLQHDTLGLPDQLTVDGNQYDVSFWGPPMGLFNVTVYQMYAQARDES